MNWNEIIEKIEKIGFYTFVSEYYWKLEKEQLRDLCKEMNYTIYRENEKLCKKLEKRVLKELKEY